MSTATNVRTTSVDAYYAMIAGPKLGEQQRAILWFLARYAHRDHTRGELAEGLGMRISSICGRVAELRALGVIEEGPPRPDRMTGVNAHPLRLMAMQAELFGA